MLAEVTHAAWQDARELKKTAAKRPPYSVIIQMRRRRAGWCAASASPGPPDYSLAHCFRNAVAFDAMLYQFKITLCDITPPIWRRVLVPDSATLHDLHEIVQIAMGWENSHLHDFVIRRRRYALPSPDDWDTPIDEAQTRLADVVKPRSRFVYQYDFGDSWRHELHIEKAVDDDAHPAPFCLDGARACPPEDSGGAWGYVEKLNILADPGHEDYDDLVEWMGDAFNPEEFDRDSVNRTFEKWKKPKKTRSKGARPRRR